MISLWKTRSMKKIKPEPYNTKLESILIPLHESTVELF